MGIINTSKSLDCRHAQWIGSRGRSDRATCFCVACVQHIVSVHFSLHCDQQQCRLLQVARVEIKDQDERAQITYSSGPFRGSEACRDVEAHWRIQDCSQVQLWDTRTHIHFHLHPQSLSPALCIRPFPSLCFIRLCVATFSSVCFIISPHLSGLGPFLHVQSLSLIANLPFLSLPFYAQVFFFLVCRRHAFIFPQFLILKSLIEKGSAPKLVMFLCSLGDEKHMRHSVEVHI